MGFGHDTEIIGKGECTKVYTKRLVNICQAETQWLAYLWVVAPASSAASDDMFLIPVESEMLPGIAKNSS